MDPIDEQSAEWKKIRRVLFQQKGPSAPATLLSGVMNRIIGTPEPQPAWSWGIPALSFGLATILLVLSFLPQNPYIGVDDFLIENGNNTMVEEFLDYPNGG